MKNILKEKDIQSFFVFGNSLIFLQNKNIFQDGKLILIDIESFGVKNEFAFFHKQENENLVSIQLNQKNELIKHNYPIDAEICFENQAFLGLNYDRLTKTYEYFNYNLLDQKIKKINNINSKSIHHKVCLPYIFYKTKNQSDIGNFHLPTETTLWQYAIADLGAEKVSKILGVFGQTLVVVGYIREYTYMLLGLDVQSGQVLWKHEEIFAAELHGKVHPVKLSCIYADSGTGKVILFEAGVYSEFEGSSGNILKWINIFKSPLSFGKYKMDAYAFDICDADEEYIYFRTSVPGYGMYSGAGIFNRKTDQLEFLDVILSENGRPISIGPQKVKATKEKFYVLDNQNTLHIYDRE
ncbi:MAG: hypothetical protein IPP05_03360 [Cytophagaceae bacterium]|nr:hypothetical protein [Cytophagaceae bacterium]MBL0303101.1 hypothetical protein [Cytophagaceae bacterium]